jgi:hypothetical protein
VPHKPPLPKQKEEADEDIESWLKSTLGSIQTSESSGLRLDAKESISNAKSQIDRALRVLDEFKVFNHFSFCFIQYLFFIFSQKGLKNILNMNVIF